MLNHSKHWKIGSFGPRLILIQKVFNNAKSRPKTYISCYLASYIYNFRPQTFKIHFFNGIQLS